MDKILSRRCKSPRGGILSWLGWVSLLVALCPGAGGAVFVREAGRVRLLQYSVAEHSTQRAERSRNSSCERSQIAVVVVWHHRRRCGFMGVMTWWRDDVDDEQHARSRSDRQKNCANICWQKRRSESTELRTVYIRGGPKNGPFWQFVTCVYDDTERWSIY